MSLFYKVKHHRRGEKKYTRLADFKSLKDAIEYADNKSMYTLNNEASRVIVYNYTGRVLCSFRQGNMSDNMRGDQK